jgi:hypothetical protein
MTAGAFKTAARTKTVEEQTGVSERSPAAIEVRDLLRLSEIARADLQRYIAKDPARRAVFAAKILCVALCQGAALHYLDKTTGVKDFDVFTFFAADRVKDFPPRRRATCDFGPSKFGRHAEDAGYAGRRVDVMGRSIAYAAGTSPIEALRLYLRTTPTRTAWYLAQKAVVIIDPTVHRGRVAWPEPRCPVSVTGRG